MHLLKDSANHLLLRQAVLIQQENGVVYGDQANLCSGVAPNLKAKAVARRIRVLHLAPQRFNLELQHADIMLKQLLTVT